MIGVLKEELRNSHSSGVEEGMIRASRSFHGIDPELQVSSEPLPVAADAGGADIIIPTAGGAPSAPSAPEDAIPGPVDGDWEPTLRAFFKQYAPAKTGEVRLCTSRRPPSGMTLSPPFSPSRRCPCTSSTGRGARRR